MAVKDEYTFDFAELSPEYSEYELEIQLVNHFRAFLIEMGGYFTFVGNQYHLEAGSKKLYVILLLFYRRLRSLVVIELKIGEFEAQYTGKMRYVLLFWMNRLSCQKRILLSELVFVKIKTRLL